YGVPDPRTGDQVMAAVETAPDASFDPDAFAAFLAEQPDLGTKWAPRFVRVVASLPTTATGKVDRRPLRAERWETDDPVWWRPDRSGGYRRMTAEDSVGLGRALPGAGRGGVVGGPPFGGGRGRGVSGLRVHRPSRALAALARRRRPRRARPVRGPRLRRRPHHHAAAGPQHRGAPLPQPVRGGQGHVDAGRAVGRPLHAGRGVRLPQGRVRGAGRGPRRAQRPLRRGPRHAGGH